MKFSLFGREIKIGREFQVIGISVLLILLTLWGWYLNTNNVSVFMAGGSPERQAQHIGLAEETAASDEAMNSSPDDEATEEIGASSKEHIININTAGKEELVSLNGIGDVKADAIIMYRKENGLFKSIEDIKNVKGIGEATFLKIKDRITVDGE